MDNFVLNVDKEDIRKRIKNEILLKKVLLSKENTRELPISEVNVEELIRKIRSDIKMKKQNGLVSSAGIQEISSEESNLNSTDSSCFMQPEYASETVFFTFLKKMKKKIEKRKFYNFVRPIFKGVKDILPDNAKYRKGISIFYLLQHDDEDFIVNAYKTLLGREPDENGKNVYLSNLRNLRMAKIEILGEIRYSKEGINKNVSVNCLRRKYLFYKARKFIYKLPILGYIIKLFLLFLCLPKIVKDIYQADNNIKQRITNEHKQVKNSIDDINRILDKQYVENFESRLEQVDKNINRNIKQVEEKYMYVEKLVDNLKQDINNMSCSFNNLNNIIDACTTETNASLDQFGQNFNELFNSINGKFYDLSNSTTEAINSVNAKINQIDASLPDILRQIRDHKLNIIDQQRRLNLLLEETRKRLPETMNTEQLKKVVAEEDSMLDAMYVTFEDRFRGTRGDIKERLKIYLPYLFQATSDKGETTILDIGCGRGEWLELLNENNYFAKGLDLNYIMVQECIELGFDVIQKDAIGYLRDQKPNSIDIITGFHIVEHLEVKELVGLFDECIRVLKPGGKVIFETPNPENMIVGACNFYFDPTHKNPIPPILLSFIAEARGFQNIETLRLHPYNYFSNKEDIESINRNLLDLFNKEQDYAIIAYKV